MKKTVVLLLVFAFFGCLSKDKERIAEKENDIDVLDTLQGVDDFSISFTPDGILTEKKYIHYYADTVMVDTDLHNDDTIVSIVREAQKPIPGAVADEKGDFILKVKGKEFRYRYLQCTVYAKSDRLYRYQNGL